MAWPLFLSLTRTGDLKLRTLGEKTMWIFKQESIYLLLRMPSSSHLDCSFGDGEGIAVTPVAGAV